MITSYQTRIDGHHAQVTVTSDLAGTVYYHWYLDGAWVGRTASPVRTFFVPPGEQLVVDVVDTVDGAFDGPGGAPEHFPARRTLFWVRSLASDVRAYRVEQRRDGGAWEELATVRATDAWSYRLLTPRLADLADYEWRVSALDAAGNAGDPLALDAERVVRKPDAPQYAIEFEAADRRVTFHDPLLVAFGVDTIGGTNISQAADYLFAHGPFTLAGSGVVKTLAFFGNLAGAEGKLALYADAAGYPGQLLAETAEYSAALARWKYVPLDAPVDAAAVWIACLSKTIQYLPYDASETVAVRYAARAYAHGFPAEFPAGAASLARAYSYCGYFAQLSS